MTLFIEIINWAFLLLGAFFCVVGGVGLLRLPDFYSRMHGSGITDTLGAGLILIGLMVQSGINLVTVKLIIIVIFLLLSSPTATHAIAKAAYGSGIKPWVKDKDPQP